MTVLISVEYTLSTEELENILQMAGYGCNYWATQIDYDDEYTKIEITDAEERVRHRIKRQDIENAIQDIVECEKEVGLHEGNRAKVYNYVINPQNNVCDATMADWIIQVAIFGEAIYG